MSGVLLFLGYEADDSLIALLGLILALVVGLGLVYLLRIHIAYRMAKKRHRDPLGWVLLSFFFSPLLTWIILLIVGDAKPFRADRE